MNNWEEDFFYFKPPEVFNNLIKLMLVSSKTNANNNVSTSERFPSYRVDQCEKIQTIKNLMARPSRGNILLILPQELKVGSLI